MPSTPEWCPWVTPSATLCRRCTAAGFCSGEVKMDMGQDEKTVKQQLQDGYMDGASEFRQGLHNRVSKDMTLSEMTPYEKGYRIGRLDAQLAAQIKEGL